MRLSERWKPLYNSATSTQNVAKNLPKTSFFPAQAFTPSIQQLGGSRRGKYFSWNFPTVLLLFGFNSLGGIEESDQFLLFQSKIKNPKSQIPCPHPNMAKNLPKTYFLLEFVAPGVTATRSGSEALPLPFSFHLSRANSTGSAEHR